MTKSFMRCTILGFVIRISLDIRHSSFVIICMNVIEIAAPDFDLAKTLDSGQVFHWEKAGDGFVGAIGGMPIYIEQHRHVLKVRAGEGQLDCLKQSSCGEI